MNTLYKPNGVKVEVNDNSLAKAKELGWTEEDPKELEAAAADKAADKKSK